jgi:predicted nuclease of predicted toxin-antitoxin system
MDFLTDVHLPINLSKFLDKQPGCTAIHINQILQKWYTADAEICKYADANNLVVITKDEDFKNSHFIKKTPRKIIRVTLGNVSNADLILLFTKYLPFILPLSVKTNFYIEVDKEQVIIID